MHWCSLWSFFSVCRSSLCTLSYLSHFLQFLFPCSSTQQSVPNELTPKLNFFGLHLLQVVEAVMFQRFVLYETCIEKWPSWWARLFYAVCLLLLQSVIPALVVATVGYSTDT